MEKLNSVSLRLGTIMLVLVLSASPAWSTGSSIMMTLSGATEQFSLNANSSTNFGNTNITASTTWNLGPPNTLNVYAYFASSTTALTDAAGHNIPSSSFYVGDNGRVLSALTGNTPYASGSGIQLESIDITPFNKTGTINDTMQFSINTAALSQLPAGTYTGTLYVQASAAGPGKEQTTPQAILVTAVLQESLGLTLSSRSVTFALAAGQANNPGGTNITAATSWVVKPSRTALNVYAYFSNGSAALTDGAGHDIPSSAFYIADNAGSPVALTNSVPPSGGNGGLQLGSTTMLGNANRTGSRTDVMVFNIDLSTGVLPQLPAGIYNGILTIQAQVTP